MKDLKQMWLIKVDQNRLENNGGTLKMHTGSFRVKQIGHYIESGNNANSNSNYRNRSNNTEIKL